MLRSVKEPEDFGEVIFWYYSSSILNESLDLTTSNYFQKLGAGNCKARIYHLALPQIPMNLASAKFQSTAQFKREDLDESCAAIFTATTLRISQIFYVNKRVRINFTVE